MVDEVQGYEEEGEDFALCLTLLQQELSNLSISLSVHPWVAGILVKGAHGKHRRNAP